MRFIDSFSIASFATTAFAGLVAIRSPPVSSKNLDFDLYPRDVYHERSLFSGISLGSYDLATSRKNTVLFDLTHNEPFENGAAVTGIKVVCVDCRTWGSAVVSTTSSSKDNDIIGNIIEFFQDPEKAIMDAFSVDLKLSLDKVGGHFEFDISARAALSYAIPIYQSLTPIGGAVGDDISIGVVLSIELVFSVTAGVDLTAGFDFSFPEDTFITVDPLTGLIKEDGFLDGQISPLPVTVTSGSATFKAALKIKLQAGTTVELFGTGFDFQLGVFANVIEYVATISSTEKCDLLITELLDVNIGAFAISVVTFNFVAVGGSPPIITTILTIPLPSLCLTLPGGGPTTVPLITAGLPSLTASAAEAVVTTPLGAIFAEISASSSSNLVASTGTGSFSLPLNSTSSVSSTSTIIASQGTAVPYFPLSFTSTSTPTIVVSTHTVIPYFPLNSTSTTTLSPLPGTNIHYPLITPTPTSSLTYSFSNTNTTLTVHPYAINNATQSQLVTSTVYATDIITLCACAQPLINCPTELASDVVVTSTRVLYTSVCRVGQLLPTTLPATFLPRISSSRSSLSSGGKVVGSSSISVGVTSKEEQGGAATKTSLHFVHLATPIVEVIYKPTFDKVTYALPTITTGFAYGGGAVFSSPTSTSTSVGGVGALSGSGGGVKGGEVRVKGLKFTYAPSPTSSSTSTTTSAGKGLVVDTSIPTVTGTKTGSAASSSTFKSGGSSSHYFLNMHVWGIVIVVVLGLVGIGL